MQRVMIIGQPGSGKSTFAQLLGMRTGLPVVHIDRIHWQDGWVERTRAEKTALCLEVHDREAWIFEGSHASTWPQRLERADTVIWLDFPLLRRTLRVVWRTLRHYGQSRPDMPEGCPERFSLEFCLWIWSTRKSGREKIKTFLKPISSEKSVVVLRSLKDVQTYLDHVEVQAQSEARDSEDQR